MDDTKTLDTAKLAIFAGEVAGVEWQHGDDLCDCTFQRIGMWTNPYIGKTLKYRFCCIWAELAKAYPQFVQEIPAFLDTNSETFVEGVAEWASLDADMPRALWYRQLSTLTGKPLAAIRDEYADQDPPRRLIPEPTSAQLDALYAALNATERPSLWRRWLAKLGR